MKMNSVPAPAYPQDQGYGKLTKEPVNLYTIELSLHELRNAMPYFDVKYATPEHWKSFADHVLDIYPQAKYLLLEFISKNGHSSTLQGLTVQVNKYLNSRDGYELGYTRDYYGKLDRLEYFVTPAQKSNFQAFITKLKSEVISNNIRHNTLGQLREEIISIAMQSENVVEFLDKLIVLCRGRVKFHNMLTWTPGKIYGHVESFNIIGTFDFKGKDIEEIDPKHHHEFRGRTLHLLGLIDMCPYFRPEVEIDQHHQLFLNQLLTGKITLPGPRRHIKVTELWNIYKGWCTNMGISNILPETTFAWQSSLDVIFSGKYFNTKKPHSISWSIS